MLNLPDELSHPVYHDEDAARIQLEAIRWPDGPFCPKCGTFDRVKSYAGKDMGPGWHYCSDCRRKFTVRVGSIFHRSHVPTYKWLLAFRLLAGSKKGFSAHQLHRTIKVDYKTAWFMEHRIRECMDESGSGPLGGEGKTLEIDETFTGYKEGGPTWTLHNEGGWQKKRGPSDRNVVLTLVERGGRARSVHIDSVKAKDLRPVVFANADTKSALMTDEAKVYRNIGKRFAGHESVEHGAEEWVRGDAHTNTIEGFFSVFKRGMKGIYQHCDEKHLQRYLHEFDFRYSNRSALGVEDAERTTRAIKGAAGKRLLYRQPRSAT